MAAAAVFQGWSLNPQPAVCSAAAAAEGCVASAWTGLHALLILSLWHRTEAAGNRHKAGSVPSKIGLRERHVQQEPALQAVVPSCSLHVILLVGVWLHRHSLGGRHLLPLRPLSCMWSGVPPGAPSAALFGLHLVTRGHDVFVASMGAGVGACTALYRGRMCPRRGMRMATWPGRGVAGLASGV
jgi:hypothetical protein